MLSDETASVIGASDAPVLACSVMDEDCPGTAASDIGCCISTTGESGSVLAITGGSWLVSTGTALVGVAACSSRD